MKQKRLQIIALLLLGTGLTGLQAQTMYVKQSNGTQTAYAYSNLRKMTFAPGIVTVQKTDNTSAVYALSSIKYLSFYDFTTGIIEPQMVAVNTLLTYPNPASEMLNIDLTGTKKEEGRISILNIEGKVMQTQKTSGMGTVSIDISQLPPGIYLCRYTSGTETKTVKIVKK